MKQRLSIVTLGVAELERSRRFYEALGWNVATEENADSIVVFDLNGFGFALFPAKALAKDIGIETPGSVTGGVTLAHNVNSKQEVDALLQEAKGAGAAIVKPAEEVFWGGYSGYFSDPTGICGRSRSTPFPRSKRMALSAGCPKLRYEFTERTMERTATCTCGQCSITMDGDPAFVVACNCRGCQTRTGSVFGVGAYFKGPQEQAIVGPFKAFERATDNGKTFTTYFCTNFGSTVYFHAGSLPGMVGVAAGCFTDPAFPSPSNALWVEHKYDWVDFPEGWTQHQGQP